MSTLQADATLRRSRSMTTRGAFVGSSNRTNNGTGIPVILPSGQSSAAKSDSPATDTSSTDSAIGSVSKDTSSSSSPTKASAGEPVHPRAALKNAQQSTSADTQVDDDPRPTRHRRGSHDAKVNDRMFLIDVLETEQIILTQEDTDGDFQITVKDMGPKAMALGSAASLGFRKYDVRGTYVLSNLLQELALAKDVGRQFIVVSESKLNENPVTRLSRMIATHFWAGLTRAIDRKGMAVICQDPKNRSSDQSFKIYVPYEDHIGQAYYRQLMATTDWGLQVHVLPPNIAPEFVKTLDHHPGILSLALHHVRDPVSGTMSWKGIPFIVPGGRFNEMYGWDSYFETLGLVVDGKWDMGKHMVDNFCYQIHHYGKILNANRSYYLTRSQPPFLTDMARCVTQHWPAGCGPLPSGIASDEPHATSGHELDQTSPVSWLRRVLMFAMREYYTVWTAAPRLHKDTGLSAYHTTGIGMPPETESSHFTHILEPFAKKRGMSVEQFSELYDVQAVQEPELDEYFVHDRAVRESGHDTTYRFEKKCADLLTVDLNSLLYKYESDIAELIDLLGVVTGDQTHEGAKCVPVPDTWRQGSGVPAHDLVDDKLARAPLNLGQSRIEPNLEAALGAQYADLWTCDVKHTSMPAPLRPTDACVWESADLWRHRAARRAATMTKLMWDEASGLFYDFDKKQNARNEYQSVTSTWALWAGVATAEQAAALVSRGLPLFEELGGLVSGTEESRGVISLDRPNRQWDYPYGWAPHQIMAWQGLAKYGYTRTAQRLAYRWLYTITKAFVDFNGTVPEKFDVVTLNHILTVEYGNVGTDFKYVPREGFGWMNASYQVGLTYLDMGMRRKLGVLSPPDKVFPPETRFESR